MKRKTKVARVARGGARAEAQGAARGEAKIGRKDLVPGARAGAVVYQTQRALAKRLGISAPRLTELIGESEWRWGRAPWTEQQAAAIAASLAERRSVNNATAGGEPATGIGGGGDMPGELSAEDAMRALARNPFKLAQIKLIVARTAAVTLDRELKAGGYLKKEDVEKKETARVFSVRAKLQEIPMRAAQLLNKTSEAEIEAILSTWMKEICDYYAGGGD